MAKANHISVDTFWHIIDQGRKENETEEDAYKRVADTLTAMDADSILQWGRIYGMYHELAYKKLLWSAAHIMDGGFCSDDGFHYFRGWLISKGRDVYLSALKDPDSLGELPRQENVRFECFNYAACDAYDKVCQGNYYDNIDKHRLPRDVQNEIMAGIEYDPDIDKQYGSSFWGGNFPKICAVYDESRLTFTNLFTGRVEPVRPTRSSLLAQLGRKTSEQAPAREGGKQIPRSEPEL